MHAALRSRRKALRLTQAEVAELLGKERSAYTRLERGDRVSLEEARKIARILDCGLDDVFPPASTPAKPSERGTSDV